MEKISVIYFGELCLSSSGKILSVSDKNPLGLKTGLVNAMLILESFGIIVDESLFVDEQGARLSGSKTLASYLGWKSDSGKVNPLLSGDRLRPWGPQNPVKEPVKIPDNSPEFDVFLSKYKKLQKVIADRRQSMSWATWLKYQKQGSDQVIDSANASLGSLFKGIDADFTSKNMAVLDEQLNAIKTNIRHYESELSNLESFSFKWLRSTAQQNKIDQLYEHLASLRKQQDDIYEIWEPLARHHESLQVKIRLAEAESRLKSLQGNPGTELTYAKLSGYDKDIDQMNLLLESFSRKKKQISESSSLDQSTRTLELEALRARIVSANDWKERIVTDKLDALELRIKNTEDDLELLGDQESIPKSGPVREKYKALQKEQKLLVAQKNLAKKELELVERQRQKLDGRVFPDDDKLIRERNLLRDYSRPEK